MSRTQSRGGRRISVRRSPIHGLGVFALKKIRKGERIIEYTGERISHREADRRYPIARPIAATPMTTRRTQCFSSWTRRS